MLKKKISQIMSIGLIFSSLFSVSVYAGDMVKIDSGTISGEGNNSETKVDMSDVPPSFEGNTVDSSNNKDEGGLSEGSEKEGYTSKDFEQKKETPPDTGQTNTISGDRGEIKIGNTTLDENGNIHRDWVTFAACNGPAYNSSMTFDSFCQDEGQTSYTINSVSAPNEDNWILYKNDGTVEYIHSIQYYPTIIMEKYLSDYMYNTKTELNHWIWNMTYTSSDGTDSSSTGDFRTDVSKWEYHPEKVGHYHITCVPWTHSWVYRWREWSATKMAYYKDSRGNYQVDSGSGTTPVVLDREYESPVPEKARTWDFNITAKEVNSPWSWKIDWSLWIEQPDPNDPETKGEYDTSLIN